MATTPNTYGRFIGRVGALAVALGIGAAIANSPGIAVAQDGSSGASATSGSAGSSTTPNSSATGSTENSEPADGDGATTDGSTGEDGENGDDGDDGEDADEQGSTDETVVENSAPTMPDDPSDETTDSGNDGGDDSSRSGGNDRLHQESTGASQIVTTSPVTDDPGADIADLPDSHDQSANMARTASAPEAATETSTFMSLASASEPPVATPATTGIGGFVSTVLSALGFGPQAASGPVAPPQPPMLWAMLGWVRREIGHMIAPFAAAATPVATLMTQDSSTTAVSPLGTPEQLAAERIATATANTLPVALMKIVLRQQFLDAANQQYPGGLDAGSRAALDKAVDEYAMAAAFQQQLLNSMTPTVVTQVAPPHIWFGQNVPGSRLLYDNPDTIYRFMGVNGASEYEIRGQFLNWSDVDARPVDTTFSVLEGLAGTTSTILTVDENFEVDEDGRFVITVSTEPANGRPNHLQLTSGSTIIAARNTLGDWNTEEPMRLSIERVGGPPNSLFAQIGGFAFLGPQVAGNPLLTTLVSLVPPLPFMPPTLRGAFTALILVVRGASQQSKYMALASTDPDTGMPRAVNTVTPPASNAEFLANQLQSNGHFELADGQALVLTIDPGRANYFVVPTYDIWTITDDYWNQQTSLNNEQAVANPDGTYTVVISPTDPGVTNWVSTGGLHQGTISIRFQDLEADPDNENAPRIVAQQVIPVGDAEDFFADDPIYFVDEQQRAAQLAARKDGFNKRWAPFPQP